MPATPASPSQWQDKDIARPCDVNLTSAIFHACACAKSLLVSVQLDDIAGLSTPVNIPGTSAEYSNWRRKIPVTLAKLFDGEDARLLLSGLQQERP